MNFLLSFQIAVDMLRQHKARALLTMVGVIIGVMAVTLIVMVSNGFQAYIQYQFSKSGSNTIFVAFDPGRRGPGQNLGSIEHMSTDDLDYLLKRVTLLQGGTGLMQVPSQTVRYENNSYDSPQVFASDQRFRELNHFDLLSGRSISEDDVKNDSSVCVIGEDIKSRLFGHDDALGKQIMFKDVVLQVVGVFKGSSFMGDNNKRMVLVPITTAQEKWIGGRRLDFMMLQPKPGVKNTDAMDAVWAAMMQRSGNKPMYRVDSNESIMTIFESVIGVAGTILAAIAALSLLVGGVGIMNIMLVSVSERTREIGLRKAVGATRRVILFQFLIEAATLSLVGGVIGMFVAWSMGNLVTIYTAYKGFPTPDGLATPFPLPAAIGASLFSASIGVVFGLYPAIRASALDPIEALRHE